MLKFFENNGTEEIGVVTPTTGERWPCASIWKAQVLEVLFNHPEPVFCLFLGVNSDYAQPTTGPVTKVTCPVIGRVQPELTLSKRQKTDPGGRLNIKMSSYQYRNPYVID